MQIARFGISEGGGGRGEGEGERESGKRQRKGNECILALYPVVDFQAKLQKSSRDFIRLPRSSIFGVLKNTRRKDKYFLDHKMEVRGTLLYSSCLMV